MKLHLTPDQLDIMAVALASPKAYAAAARLTEACRGELAMRDRRGREDGPLYRIVEAINAGCDPDALAEHLDHEAAVVEARHAAARDSLAELRVQLDARRAHHCRHDDRVRALIKSLAGEVALLERAASTVQNANALELAVLMDGGFTLEQAQASIDYAAARKKQHKLDALVAAGIAEADAPPVLTEEQVAEQQHQRAARLKTDLERVSAFLRDVVRDVAGLPGWVRDAIEAGTIALHDDATNRRLLPA